MTLMRGVDFLDLGGADVRVGLCSLGLTRMAFLPVFLGLPNARFSYAFTGDPRSYDLFIGWGRKPSGGRAVRLAEANDTPFLLLEDGFLRSVHPNSVTASPALSLVADDYGIFYDGRGPSRLERLITDAALSSPAETEEGARIIDTLRDLQLCKYNDFPEAPKADAKAQEPGQRVLLIDQTAGDLSVEGASAGPADFLAMLEAARDENPGAQILVKSHPETVAGKRTGYLTNAAIEAGCKILADRCNPWHLFAQVDKVYTVSSQLGFDALMAGKPPRCFGMPFYAGWGLSDDQQTCSRRRAQPSLEQLAFAAYGRYCRYVDPYRSERTTFSQTARTLAALRSVAQRGRSLGPFLNIYPWNRKAVSAMFQLPAGRQTFFASPQKAIAHSAKHGLPLTAWSSRAKPDLAGKCAAAGVALNLVEDGFVRSVGLGSNFHQPMSLILDTSGIHYDSSKASDLEQLLATHEFDDDSLERARKLIGLLTAQEITKYNLNTQGPLRGWPQDRLKILVPGQVENDASVLRSGSPFKKSKDLLGAVRDANPDAFIVFKPHPDVMSGQRPGLWNPADVDGLADVFLHDASIVAALAACNQVHVLSSLAGFEGLLRGKQVTCWGLPFYAGWGLTTDVLPCARRQRALSLDELVAGSMILYPNYLDPVTQMPCGPEIVIQRILEQRAAPEGPGALVLSRRLLGRFRRALRASALRTDSRAL